MFTPYKKCPVPKNQQPRYEYSILKESYLFEFTLLPLPTYNLKLLKIVGLTTLISSPFIALSIDVWKNPVNFLITSTICSALVLLMILIRAYLGWSYVSKRLLSATIIYEESGWYDVEFWIKSAVDLAQDRLIAEYTIKPTLKKIQYSAYIIIIYLVILQLKNAI
mmetsp:Transcript_6377/g.27125  ORF Transcript_6377/g.27125 Transcript_6377/m.27125 type:complete len:165 (+) Transcript_6377:1347-1841(+)